jgi:hypothetical protein
MSRVATCYKGVLLHVQVVLTGVSCPVKVMHCLVQPATQSVCNAATQLPTAQHMTIFSDVIVITPNQLHNLGLLGACKHCASMLHTPTQ